MSNQSGHAVDHALHELGTQLEHTIGQLQAAAGRIEELKHLRAAGHLWFDIVSHENRPLIVEMVSLALNDLGTVGSQFRREQARALQSENVNITRIGQLFGVSRQRASTLIRKQAQGPKQDKTENANSRPEQRRNE